MRYASKESCCEYHGHNVSHNEVLTKIRTKNNYTYNKKETDGISGRHEERELRKYDTHKSYWKARDAAGKSGNMVGTEKKRTNIT